MDLKNENKCMQVCTLAKWKFHRGEYCLRLIFCIIMMISVT